MPKLLPVRECPYDDGLRPSNGVTQISTWVYKPCNGKKMCAREYPSIHAARTSNGLTPGDEFGVSEERRRADGITYLQLADGRGWVFDYKPGEGTMCEPKNMCEPRTWQDTCETDIIAAAKKIEALKARIIANRLAKITAAALQDAAAEKKKAALQALKEADALEEAVKRIRRSMRQW